MIKLILYDQNMEMIKKMGICKIKTYRHKIGSVYENKDIYDDYRFYLTNGEGCGAIWFKDLGSAIKALAKDGIKTGRDLFDCTKCSCHYSFGTKEHKKYPEFACKKVKEEYAKSFETD